MMMTPSGTITPARVFIIGAGVAGLQAIATAKRLGARVEAFDTRPVVEEQVQSLGAKFLKVDLGETGQTKDGYAKELTEDQLQLQREAMKKACGNADIVITTAQVFGRRAPLIVTEDMVAAMKPGSVIVDFGSRDRRQRRRFKGGRGGGRKRCNDHRLEQLPRTGTGTGQSNVFQQSRKFSGALLGQGRENIQTQFRGRNYKRLPDYAWRRNRQRDN